MYRYWNTYFQNFRIKANSDKWMVKLRYCRSMLVHTIWIRFDTAQTLT